MHVFILFNWLYEYYFWFNLVNTYNAIKINQWNINLYMNNEISFIILEIKLITKYLTNSNFRIFFWNSIKKKEIKTKHFKNIKTLILKYFKTPYNVCNVCV